MNTLYIALELTPGHVMLIIAVILLLFGGKKIPELMKGLGSGVKEFKKAAQDEPTPAPKKEEETKE
jgi:sec-independent protein translocase protein TatA